MNSKAFEIQKQIRDNQLTLTEFMKDLNYWEKDIESKDTLLRKEKGHYTQNQSLITESYNEKEKNELQKDKYKSENNKKIMESLKRDKNSIKNFYDKWDKFNVEEEIKEIEESSKENEIKSKVIPSIIRQNNLILNKKNVQSESVGDTSVTISNVSETRNQLNDPFYFLEVLKRESNTFFKLKNYYKAIDLLNQALNLIDKTDKTYIDDIATNEELKCKINSLYFQLYSNRGNNYLKLNLYKDSLSDLKKAFNINNCDVKVIYRLSFVYYKLMIYDNSITMINYLYNLYNDSKINIGENELDLFKDLENDVLSSVEADYRKDNKELKVIKWENEDENYDIIFTKEISTSDNKLSTEYKSNTTYNIDREINQNIQNSDNKEDSSDTFITDTDIKNDKKEKSSINDESGFEYRFSKSKFKEIKEGIIIEHVNNIIKDCSSSKLKLAFSNLNNHKDKLNLKCHLILQINPDEIPTIFKNDLDKDILREILECVENILPENIESIIKILSNLMKVNRFSLIIKFIKKQRKLILFLVLTSIFNSLEKLIYSNSSNQIYESLFIQIKDQYFK